MGRKDLQKKSYFHDAERFADLINGLLCDGRQVLSAEDLTELDSQTGQSGVMGYGGMECSGDGCTDSGRGMNKGKSRILKERRRDLVRRAAFGVNFMVIGLENQEETDYLMPLRCMSYDTAEYEKQAAQIGKEVRNRSGNRVTKAEFLSGFTQDNRLTPCVTVVLYYGENWDGALALHDILDFKGIPKEFRDKVNDYQICLCEVRKFKNTEVFKTDVRQVFDCIRYAGDPDKLYELIAEDPAYRVMEPDTYDVIAAYTKTAELMKVKSYGEKEGRIDMCKAITELIERGRREGLEQGLEQGIEQGRTAGMADAIMELLEDLGQIPQRVMELIQVQDDPEVLSRWHKIAARAGSVAEFEQKM